jgi:hypothetical protein
MMSVSTLAIDVTVSSLAVTGWRFPMTAVKVRVYPNNTFLTSEGELIQKGEVGRSAWYREYNCTVTGSQITLPAMTLDSTDDSDVPAASYSAIFFDAKGNRIDNYYANFRVPSTYGSSITWQQIRAYTESITISLPSGYYPVATTDTRLEKDLSLYSNSLTSAVTALGSSETVLACTRATTLSTSLSIPDNIKLKPTGECLITLAASVTLTIGKMEYTGSFQVFDSDAAGASVLFARGAVPYIDIGWWVGTDSADTDILATDAISEALASTTANDGGRILFPESNYTTTGGHTITSSTTIEGSTNQATIGTKGTQIKLVSPTTNYLFRIQGGQYSIRIRDLLLEANSTSTYGLLAEGTAPTTTADLDIERVTFSGFDIGLYAKDLGGDWQLAQVNIRQSIFQSNDIGVKTESLNSQFNFDGTNWQIPNSASARGILTDGIGMTQIKGCEIAGSGQGAFLEIDGAHVQINIEGCQDENVGTFIINDASDITGIVNLKGNLIQSNIYINASMTLNSEGNNYIPDSIRVSAGTPHIFSKNDNVRTDLGTTEAPATIPANPLRLVKSNDPITQFEFLPTLALGSGGISDGGMKIRHWSRFYIPEYLSTLCTTCPAVSILDSGDIDGNTQTLLRLGRASSADQAAQFYYDFWRQNSGDGNGELVVSGNQTGFVHYYFKNGGLYAEGAIRGQATGHSAAATITINPLTANHQFVTIDQATTFQMVALSAFDQTRSDGQVVSIEIVQDGTGGRSCALNTSAGHFDFGSDIASITCSAGANLTDLLVAKYSKRKNAWLVIDFKKGY